MLKTNAGLAIGVTFVSKAASEGDRVEALHSSDKRWKRKDRLRASCEIISSLWLNSAKNSTPVWLIGPNVSLLLLLFFIFVCPR